MKGQETFWNERCDLDRLGGRAPRIGQARGRSATARTGFLSVS